MATRQSEPVIMPKLNFDILALAQETCETEADMLAFMHTCRALYRTGIRPLVRLGPRVHTSKLHSFHAFMFNHARSSFRALHSLSFCVSKTFSQLDAIMIVELLKTGRTSLRKLSFEGDVGELRADHPFLVFSGTFLDATAIQMRHHQFNNNLVPIGSQSPTLLDRLQRILYEDGDLLLSLLGSRPPIPSQLDTIPSTISPIAGCFSNLTSLVVQQAFLPRLSVMVMMFPNLQDLYWEWDYGHGGTHKIEELRDQSEALREAGRTWTQLRSIKADIDSIHVLALRQELDLLAILTELDPENGISEDAIELALPDLPAKSLIIEVNPKEPDYLEYILSNTNLKKIEDFTLNLNLYDAETVNTVLDTLCERLEDSECTTKHLTLRLGFNFRFKERSDVDLNDEIIELKTFIRNVKTALPLLDRLCIRIASPWEPEGTTNNIPPPQWISLATDFSEPEGTEGRYAVDSSVESLRIAAMESPTGAVAFHQLFDIGLSRLRL